MAPRVLCITGGMGAGKSFAVDYFRALGWPVYLSDERAKHLVAHSRTLQSALKQAFGEDVLDASGMPRAAVLGDRAFASRDQWEKLNSLIHPAVFEDFNHWLGAQSDESHPWVVRESALLFEVGIAASCDRILLVTAPESVRRDRVVARTPALPPEMLFKRMAYQWDDAYKRSLLRPGDWEISNTGNKEIFLERIAEWYRSAF